MTARRWGIGCGALLLLLTAGRAGAADSGAWRTFIRPVEFTDLLARGDQIWGATAEGGLFRWRAGADTFQVIRREPGSIASNRLTRLATDRTGRLWVGTRASGASYLEPGASRWERVRTIDGLLSDSITVLEAQGDTLWIGTAAGLALWNGRSVAGSLPDDITVSFDTVFVSKRINGVAVIGDELWVATPRGIGFAHISGLLGDWRKANAGLPSLEVADLASNGVDLFARIGTAVYRYRVDLGSWVPQSDPGVVRNLEDDDQVVLAAGDAGIFRWQPTSPDTGWVRVADALAVTAGGEDPEPTVDSLGTYFAAAADTLYEQSGSSWTPHPTPAGPIVNDLLHLAVDGPHLYVTSVGRGFSRFDGAAWRWWRYQYCTAGCDTDTTFIEPAFAFTLMIGHKGRKWVGCWSSPPYVGVFQRGGAISSFDDFGDTQSFDHKVVVEDISQIDRMRQTWVMPGARDSSGTIWFGSETPVKGDVEPLGLTAYDSLGHYLGGFNESNSSMKGKYVHGLAVTPNGRLWIGYDGQGLDFLILPSPGLPPNPTNFFHLEDTNNLAVRGVAAIGDSVWILTNTELRLYGSQSGLGNKSLRTIPVRGGQAQLAWSPLAIAADGTVWAATASGLKSFRHGSPSDSFSVATSPLPDDEVRSLAIDPANGTVWITTAGGLASFDPSYVPPPAPPIAALRVRLYPNPAKLTGLGLQLRLTGDATSYQGEIYDLSGRRVRQFAIASNGSTIWDGRDDDGRPVKPGLYFVRASAGGRQAVARVIVLH